MKDDQKNGCVQKIDFVGSRMIGVGSWTSLRWQLINVRECHALKVVFEKVYVPSRTRSTLGVGWYATRLAGFCLEPLRKLSPCGLGLCSSGGVPLEPARTRVRGDEDRLLNIAL